MTAIEFQKLCTEADQKISQLVWAIEDRELDANVDHAVLMDVRDQLVEASAIVAKNGSAVGGAGPARVAQVAGGSRG